MGAVRYDVIGQHTVAGVKPGGVVVLDPNDPAVNVRALVKARHIAPRPKPAKRKPRGKTGDTEGGDG